MEDGDRRSGECGLEPGSADATRGSLPPSAFVRPVGARRGETDVLGRLIACRHLSNILVRCHHRHGGEAVSASRTRDGLMRQQTLAEIRRRLIRGQWPPNTVLQEQPLADELQVSKTPVREALQTLSVQNLLKPEPRVGYRVSDIALDDLAEVFEFRILLEAELVGVAASRGTGPGADEGEDALAPWEKESSFHQNLARLGGGPRMQRSLAELLQESARAMHYYHLQDLVLTEVIHDHEALVEAVRARDVTLARSLMTIHLTRIRESLMASFRQTLRDKNLLA